MSAAVGPSAEIVQKGMNGAIVVIAAVNDRIGALRLRPPAAGRK